MLLIKKIVNILEDNRKLLSQYLYMGLLKRIGTVILLLFITFIIYNTCITLGVDYMFMMPFILWIVAISIFILVLPLKTTLLFGLSPLNVIKKSLNPDYDNPAIIKNKNKIFSTNLFRKSKKNEIVENNNTSLKDKWNEKYGTDPSRYN